MQTKKNDYDYRMNINIYKRKSIISPFPSLWLRGMGAGRIALSQLCKKQPRLLVVMKEAVKGEVWLDTIH